MILIQRIIWFHQFQKVTNLQVVLVHHLRFYGTKRSSRRQDGTKDKDMTQTPSLKPIFHSTLSLTTLNIFMKTKSRDSLRRLM